MKRKTGLIMNSVCVLVSIIYLVQICKIMTFSFMYEWIAVGIFISFIITQGVFLIGKEKWIQRKSAFLCGAVSFLALLMDACLGVNRYPYYSHAYGIEPVLWIVLLFPAVQLALLFPWKRVERERLLTWDMRDGFRAAGIFAAVFLIISLIGSYATGLLTFQKCDPELAERYEKETGICAAGSQHIAAVKNDGTVYAKGKNESGQCDVQAWKQIVSVSAGKRNTYGLTKDGCVLVAGDNSYGQCAAETWTDIVQIAAGEDYVAGLREDGTVVFAGNTREITPDARDKSLSDDIIQIVAGSWYAAGLKEDGTVIVFSNTEDAYDETSTWKNIRFLSGGKTHLAALTAEGQVYLAGEGFFGQCDLDGSTNNQFVWTGNERTVVLKTNGTLIAIGEKKEQLKRLSKERGLLCITDGPDFIAGVREDGTILKLGSFPGAEGLEEMNLK